MKVSEKLRKDTGHIWEKIFEHPFVIELYNGSLPIEKFKFYILQDYNYLVDAIKNFAVIASRVDSVDVMKEVVQVVHLEAVSEFNEYEKLLNKLGYTIEDAMNIEPLPVNVSYSSFLIATSSLKSYQEAITSVLPCFWSYAEIAKYHEKKLNENSNSIYVDWASVYLSDDYLNLVNRIKNIVDIGGKSFPYEKLKYIFMTASRYEYMYWNSVYNMDKWPV